MNLVSEEVTRALPRQYQTSSLCNGGRGRPRYNIPKYQITSLLEIRFTVPSIALILGVSIRTVRCRMSDYNLAVKVYYSDITDEQMDKIVEKIQMQFPTCGNKEMVGHLQSRGVRVTQESVRGVLIQKAKVENNESQAISCQWTWGSVAYQCAPQANKVLHCVVLIGLHVNVNFT